MKSVEKERERTTERERENSPFEKMCNNKQQEHPLVNFTLFYCNNTTMEPQRAVKLTVVWISLVENAFRIASSIQEGYILEETPCVGFLQGKVSASEQSKLLSYVLNTVCGGVFLFNCSRRHDALVNLGVCFCPDPGVIYSRRKKNAKFLKPPFVRNRDF